MVIIPMVFVVVGIVGIVSSITGKQFGSRRNGETTGLGNNQAGRPSTGRIINIWDESKTSVGKFGEETYYTYRVKFEYEDEYGKKCEQIEDVES